MFPCPVLFYLYMVLVLVAFRHIHKGSGAHVVRGSPGGKVKKKKDHTKKTKMQWIGTYRTYRVWAPQGSDHASHPGFGQSRHKLQGVLRYVHQKGLAFAWRLACAHFLPTYHNVVLVGKCNLTY